MQVWIYRCGIQVRKYRCGNTGLEIQVRRDRHEGACAKIYVKTDPSEKPLSYGSPLVSYRPLTSSLQGFCTIGISAPPVPPSCLDGWLKHS